MKNMSSEINFLHDKNLQIRLNTNVRMWSILTRNLPVQLAEEEQEPPLETQPPRPRTPQP